MKNQKLFWMVSKDFGEHFTFNAQSIEDATSKAKSYNRYHSMPDHFKAVETLQRTDNEFNNLHNEYV